MKNESAAHAMAERWSERRFQMHNKWTNEVKVVRLRTETILKNSFLIVFGAQTEY